MPTHKYVPTKVHICVYLLQRTKDNRPEEEEEQRNKRNWNLARLNEATVPYSSVGFTFSWK